MSSELSLEEKESLNNESTRHCPCGFVHSCKLLQKNVATNTSLSCSAEYNLYVMSQTPSASRIAESLYEDLPTTSTKARRNARKRTGSNANKKAKAKPTKKHKRKASKRSRKNGSVDSESLPDDLPSASKIPKMELVAAQQTENTSSNSRGDSESSESTQKSRSFSAFKTSKLLLWKFFRSFDKTVNESSDVESSGGGIPKNNIDNNTNAAEEEFPGEENL